MSLARVSASSVSLLIRQNVRQLEFGFDEIQAGLLHVSFITFKVIGHCFHDLELGLQLHTGTVIRGNTEKRLEMRVADA